MALTDVRRRCQLVLRDLDLPRPYSAEAMAASLSRQRGRMLHVEPGAGGRGPCGVWLGTARADYVFYDVTSSGVHREHILAHEFAHVILDHGGTGGIDLEAVASLTTLIDPATVTRMLSRDAYSTTEEQEAEVLASLIIQFADRDHADRAQRAELAAQLADPEARRLDQVLTRREQVDE